MKTETGQGGCYCRPERRGQAKTKRTSPKWCDCGFKVGGPNHNEGAHHNGTVAKCRKGKW